MAYDQNLRNCYLDAPLLLPFLDSGPQFGTPSLSVASIAPTPRTGSDTLCAVNEQMNRQRQSQRALAYPLF